MFVYLVASFSVFAVMSLADLPDDNEHEFSDYESPARKHPLLGFAIVCGIGSLPEYLHLPVLLPLSTSEHCFRGWFVSVPGSNGRWCSHFRFTIISFKDQRNHFHPRPVFDDDEPKKDPWSKLSETYQ